MYIQLGRVYLRETFEDCIGLFNSPLIISLLFVSESLLGNTPVTMTILQKCLGTVCVWVIKNDLVLNMF